MKVNDIVKEAVLKAYDGKQATIDDPEHGKTINLDLTKPENAASLKPNDQGQLEYDPTPEIGGPAAAGEPAGPKPGTQVTIKADETGDFAVQDKTDDLISDVELDVEEIANNDQQHVSPKEVAKAGLEILRKHGFAEGRKLQPSSDDQLLQKMLTIAGLR